MAFSHTYTQELPKLTFQRKLRYATTRRKKPNFIGYTISVIADDRGLNLYLGNI